MVLVCNDPKGAVKVIDDLPSGMSQHKDSIQRIKCLKKTTSLGFSSLKKTTEYQVASKLLDQFYAN
jgi:beta-N-acetylhexosaminidase